MVALMPGAERKERLSFAGAREELLATAEDFLACVALCIVLKADIRLQERLRVLAGVSVSEPLWVRPPQLPAWLVFRDGGRVEAARHAGGDVRRLSLDEVANNHQDLWSEITRAVWRNEIQEEAQALGHPVFDCRRSLTGTHMARLLEWAPLLEHFAYRGLMVSSVLTDHLRRLALSADPGSRESDTALTDYWNILHVTCNLSTIACSSATPHWAAALAGSPSWGIWTPSFSLTRERTLWLMAGAAKSAVAFGEPAVDKYLVKLFNADHPMKTFDALVGLVSIGLDQERRLSDKILAELGVGNPIARHAASNARHAALMLDTALATLRYPDVAETRIAKLTSVVPRAQRGQAPDLLGLDALRRDSIEILDSGEILGILALPRIVRTSPADYYPSLSGQGFMMRPREIRQVIRRAWGTKSRESISTTIH